jgi:hypothetical protein
MSIQFPTPVLTPVGALFAGDEIRLSNVGGVHVVDRIHPVGNGEYRIASHCDVDGTRTYKSRQFHGEFAVWLIAAGDLFNHDQ